MLDWFASKAKRRPKGDPPVLLVGIGNPGDKYEDTRHNVGFMCVDLLADRFGIRLNDKRKDVVLGQGTIAGKAVVLAKPRTFVNHSGAAARYLASRFGTKPTEMLVLIDDLDLPVGTMRIRKSGGSGGHNGLNSINRDLSTQEYPRLRIGISRPAHGAIEHVLSGFPPEEQESLNDALARAVEAVEAWVENGTDYAMNHFN
jgi:PTH1 family peptidyl-tRNA hydrolase